MITCQEIIDTEEAKNILKNVICEAATSLYVLLAFPLITIALLIKISIEFCLIKYKVKQKHLLPYYVTIENLINAL